MFIFDSSVEIPIFWWFIFPVNFPGNANCLHSFALFVSKFCLIFMLLTNYNLSSFMINLARWVYSNMWYGERFLEEISCNLCCIRVRVQRELFDMEPWERPREEFQLLKKLGEGHFGEVWEAVWTTKKQKVAIKMLKQGVTLHEMECFSRETNQLIAQNITEFAKSVSKLFLQFFSPPKLSFWMIIKSFLRRCYKRLIVKLTWKKVLKTKEFFFEPILN